MDERSSGRRNVLQFLLNLKTTTKIIVGLSIIIVVGVVALIALVTRDTNPLTDRDIARQGYSPESIPREVLADLEFYWEEYWGSEGFDSDVRYVWSVVNVRGYEEWVCSSLDRGLPHEWVAENTMNDFYELTVQDSLIIYAIAISRGCDYHWD